MASSSGRRGRKALENQGEAKEKSWRRAKARKKEEPRRADWRAREMAAGARRAGRERGGRGGEKVERGFDTECLSVGVVGRR
jgi:hypothetical protein